MNRKRPIVVLLLLMTLFVVAVVVVNAHEDDLPTPVPDGDDSTVTIDFTPTYYDHIQPIMQANCTGCHVEGEIGYESFAMDYAADIMDAARDIELVITTGYMPPWPPGEESPHFLYERTLTDNEIALIAAWVDEGAPAGDPANAVDAEVVQTVPPIVPDLTLQMPAPYLPNDDFTDDYRCFMLDPGFAEDTYITAYDIIPDNTEAVHHTILFLATEEQRAEAEAKDGADGQPGWSCYGATGLTTGGGANPEMMQRFLPLISELGGITGLNQLIASEDAAAQIDAAIEAEPDGELATIIAQFGGTDALMLLLQRVAGNQNGIASVGNVGNWVPGNVPTHFPEGTGILVPEGDFIVMQMHYYTSASTDPDQSSVVLETATGDDMIALTKMGIAAPVEVPCPTGIETENCARDVAVAASQDSGALLSSDGLLAICGQTADQYVDMDGTNAATYCEFAASTSGWAIAINNHMHQLGATTHTTLNPDTPDEQILLDIPDWDFDWQGDYWFADPVWVDQGDTVRLTCTWDNSISSNNPEPRYVVWGEGTKDEMCLSSLTMLPAEPGTPPPVQYGEDAQTIALTGTDVVVQDPSYTVGVHDHDEPMELTDAATTPQVFLNVTPDPLGGYTVRIQTFNFTFAPQNAGLDHRDGEGHAHLYLNGEKVARIYGEWFHLEELPAGSNTLTVTLNSNTHVPLHANGAAIESSVIVEVAE